MSNESIAGADASVKVQRHDIASLATSLTFARGAIKWEMIDIVKVHINNGC